MRLPSSRSRDSAVGVPSTVSLSTSQERACCGWSAQLAACGAVAAFARSVVCDVELHDRGTRLTLRSMATVVNQTQRTLAVDLELPHTPMKHLGVLAAGEQLAVAESHLDGGLRITDCGVGASAAQVQVALNEVDEAIAMGRARPGSGLDLPMHGGESRVGGGGSGVARCLRGARTRVPCPRARALSSRRRSSRASYLLARTHFTSSP